MIINFPEESSTLQETGSIVCRDCIDMLPHGQDWQTRLAVERKCAGKIGHKMEQSLRQKIDTIDELH